MPGDLVPLSAIRPLAGGTVSSRRADSVRRATMINPLSGAGLEMDQHSRTYFARPLCLTREEIDAMLQFSPMGARIVHREPNDAMREGVEIEVDGATDGPQSRPLLEEFRRLQANDRVSDGRRWARAYGGGAVVILADDRAESMAEPLRENQIRRIHQLIDVDRHELTVFDLSTYVGGGSVGQPTRYLWTRNGRSVVVHASRMILMHGVQLPYRSRRQNNWWGGSILDLVWEALRNYASAHEDAAEAIGKLVQDVFMSKHLAASVDAGDLDAVRTRLEALSIGLGIRNAINLDKDDESYTAVPRPMNGVKDILEALVAYLVAATDMPRSILLGETPGGLNAGENAGEIRAWYDHVRVIQEKVYKPALDRILHLIMLQREGPTQGRLLDAEVSFPPLWQPTEKELAEIRKINAEARKLDLDALLLSTEEARTDPDLDGRYTLTEEPPPAPEEEAELGMTPEDEDPFGDVPTDLISARAAAERLGVSMATVHGLRKRGRLTGWTVGSQTRYSAEEIARLVSSTAAVV